MKDKLKNIDIEDKKVSNLIQRTNKLVKLLYFLLIIGIILASIVIAKELRIVNFLISILKVLSPLFIGFVIAWLFNPIIKKINDAGIPKILSTLIVYFIFVTFIVVFVRIFIPVLYKQLNDLVVSLPNILDKISLAFERIMNKFSMDGIDLSNVVKNISVSLKEYTLNITSSMPKHLVNFIISFFSGLGTIMLSLVVGIYMSFDFDNISVQFLKLIPEKHREEIKELLTNIGTEVRKTVNGTLLVALMVLVCDTVAFTAIGLESPLLFGVLCGLTDLIPYIGPYIGGAAAVVVGFSMSTPIGIATLIACITVQLVENYILQPVVMSKAIELNPVIIIVGLLIFGHFFGVIGMVLATPILALLKVIYEFVKKKFNLFA